MGGDLTLYAITDTLPALLDSLEGLEPDTPEYAECAAELDRYFAALPAKVDGVAQMLAHWHGQVDTGKSEVKRIQARTSRFERAIDRLEGYCIAVLERLDPPKRGPRKLEGATATLKLAKMPAKLNITNQALIPAEYHTVIPATVTVCASAVKDALKMGIEVPGAELITDRNRLVVE